MAKTGLPPIDAALYDRLVGVANDIYAAGIEAGKAAALSSIMSAIGQVGPAQLPTAALGTPAKRGPGRPPKVLPPGAMALVAVKRGPGRPRKNPVATTPPSATPEPKAEKTTAVGPNDRICKVPKCNKKVVAKGLCQSHYRKATAQKFDLDALTLFNLEVLGQDGRATRWEKNKKK